MPNIRLLSPLVQKLPWPMLEYTLIMQFIFYIASTLAEGQSEHWHITLEELCRLSSSCVKQGQSNLRYCKLRSKT